MWDLCYAARTPVKNCGSHGACRERLTMPQPAFVFMTRVGLMNCWLIKAVYFLWSPYGIGQAIIFSSCHLFFLLSFPRLISAAADRMSAMLPHMVWP